MFQQETKRHVQADGGLGDIQLQQGNQGCPEDALISACLGDVVGQTRINRDQSLHAFKDHLMHVRRKSWAFPLSQLGATRRKRFNTRTWLDTWAFPSTWANSIPTVNSQVGGLSSQDSRSPKHKAYRYTVMQHLNHGIEALDFCLDASICKAMLRYSHSTIKLLREHGAWDQENLPTSSPHETARPARGSLGAESRLEGRNLPLCHLPFAPSTSHLLVCFFKFFRWWILKETPCIRQETEVFN